MLQISRRKRWRERIRRAQDFLFSLIVFLCVFAAFLSVIDPYSITWMLVWVGTGLCVLGAAIFCIVS